MDAVVGRRTAIDFYCKVGYLILNKLGFLNKLV